MNSYVKHILVLPEDDADRQIAAGFLLNLPNDPKIQVLKASGGWTKVIEDFIKIHVKLMEKFPKRHMVLLLDFDENPDRVSWIKTQIPPGLSDRVLVVGAWSNPEHLKRSLGLSYETIGGCLATECGNGLREVWESELLKHNRDELSRMAATLHPILFRSDRAAE